VFVIGRIWERAERQPFREAIVDGGTEASRAVSSAGVILAVSFALLAIIPLSAFRQFALAMVAGIFIDTFVVRSFVVPAVLGLLGRLSTWPSHRARH
jgi:RND superfamily putative drug exporter